MFKSFSIWLEEREDEHVRHILLSRLGLKDPNIKLNQVDQDRLKQALGSMDLDDERVNNLMDWVKHSQESSLRELIEQIGNIRPKKVEKLPGVDAQLPPGQPPPPRDPMHKSGMENLAMPQQGF